MQFGVTVPGLRLFQGLGGQPAWANDITTAQIARIIGAADELGYDYTGVPWHLVMQKGADARNFGPRWPDSRSAAGFLLGATRRMTVRPLFVVPCEPPVSLAKGIATLDWISGGRMVPVLMTGYLRAEFDFLGVPYGERGAIMDEYVEAMIELWSSDEPVYEGRYVHFSNIVFEPKPYQQPLPIWFGGRAKPALRRVARFGSGWQSYATPHREMLAMVEYIHNQPEFVANRRPLGVTAYFVEATHDPVTHEEKGGRRTITGNEAILEQLGYLATIGVNSVNAPLSSRANASGREQSPASVEDYLERLHWFAEEIMPEARKLRTPFDGPALRPA
jgi:hypothetical protein